MKKLNFPEEYKELPIIEYPESLRLVRYYDEEDDREFTFLTNAKQLSALDVANRWRTSSVS